MTTPESVRVICLPFAGAGASFFRPWNKIAPAGVEFAPLQLPGRERLVDEPPFTDLHAAADALLPAAAAHAEAGPVAVLGHCFLGATLAYEITRRLVAAGHRDRVRHLIVSAARAPFIGAEVRTAGLTDDEFLAHVGRITGYSHAAMEIPEMRDVLMGALRADFLMDEGYTPDPAATFDVPLTTVHPDDDALVSAEALAGWDRVTSGEVRRARVAGGHMYLAEDPRPLIDVVAAALGAVPAATVGA